MSETTGTFVTSDGTELFTRTVTPDTPRYDILIVHGLAEHSGRWSEPAAQFAASGAVVHMLDLRGHGQSGGHEMHVEDFAVFADDVAQFAAASAAASGRPWVLYGHSMGGMICTGYLVDQRSPAPNAAVLSSPALDDNANPILKRMAGPLGKMIPNMKFPTDISADQLSRDSAVGEAYFADPLVATKITAGMGRAFFAEQKRLVGRVGEIITPTLVFHGAEDPLVPPSASAALTRSPSVQRRLYPNLRHETHNEPEGKQVIGDVIDWIEATIL
jgi:alpha-beta hydrolase superfamily lysophospholipase